MEVIRVTQVPATIVRMGQSLPGTLHLTRNHMIFRTNDREVWICYPIIAEAIRRPEGKALRIICQDFMFLTFEFQSQKNCEDVYKSLEGLCHPRSLQQLYCFTYSPAAAESGFSSWNIYNAAEEMNRQQVDWNLWRVSKANFDYQLCTTYPRYLVVPASISDSVLSHAAKFRSQGRLPVLSYYHAFNKCTIVRCSQPLVGLKQQRSPQDEALILAVFATTMPPEGFRGSSADNSIVDLRPQTTAIAQTALGGGTENIDRYPPARKFYMGIDNLHVMRDSLGRVFDALRHSDVSSNSPNPTSLERSQWLHHTQLLLSCARTVVHQVHFKCSHVVIHCSDGWDRTPQVTSLSMLCLDGYYRTLEGFAVLIEKEWLSFGHKFITRNGAMVNKPFIDATNDGQSTLLSNVTSLWPEAIKGKQTGPIFQQFLDCTFQIQQKYPNAFEFNERFLRRLLYHVYACQYGSFISNSEKERAELKLMERTRSVWDYFLARRQQFINPNYEQTSEALIPPDQPKWWYQVFGRQHDDMNDLEAWRKDIKTPTEPVTTTSANELSGTQVAT